MHAEGLYDDEDRSTDEGVFIRIKLKLFLLLLFYILQNTNYDYYGDT